ncbi:MAG TPA: hypothetical protein VF503_13980 [Sphingobium sp.]|uniref:hypothetical protein n=1 Tax=Sphingobium sp. TaxID=1912891 RepID=UPI002ED3C1FB
MSKVDEPKIVGLRQKAHNWARSASFERCLQQYGPTANYPAHFMTGDMPLSAQKRVAHGLAAGQEGRLLLIAILMPISIAEISLS